MKEKNNTKPEKCPYCGKTGIVVNGYDSTTEKTPVGFRQTARW